MQACWALTNQVERCESVVFVGRVRESFEQTDSGLHQYGSAKKRHKRTDGVHEWGDLEDATDDTGVL